MISAATGGEGWGGGGGGAAPSCILVAWLIMCILIIPTQHAQGTCKAEVTTANVMTNLLHVWTWLLKARPARAKWDNFHETERDMVTSWQLRDLCGCFGCYDSKCYDKTTLRKRPSRKSHVSDAVTIFTNWEGRGYLVAVTGSTWLLQIYVSVTGYICPALNMWPRH